MQCLRVVQPVGDTVAAIRLRIRILPVERMCSVSESEYDTGDITRITWGRRRVSRETRSIIYVPHTIPCIVARLCDGTCGASKLSQCGEVTPSRRTDVHMYLHPTTGTNNTGLSPVSHQSSVISHQPSSGGSFLLPSLSSYSSL